MLKIVLIKDRNFSERRKFLSVVLFVFWCVAKAQNLLFQPSLEEKCHA